MCKGMGFSIRYLYVTDLLGLTTMKLYISLCLFLLSAAAFADDYYEKGRSAYGSGQYEEAIDWFRKSAEAGYDQGQYAYGLVSPITRTTSLQGP